MMPSPTEPLPLARPLGKFGDFEFKRMRTLSSADAQRNTTRARNSCSVRVRGSMTRTPETRPDFASYTTVCAMLYGRSVRRPVARAAGRLAVTLEKYERVTQPRWHGPQ